MSEQTNLSVDIDEADMNYLRDLAQKGQDQMVHNIVTMHAYDAVVEYIADMDEYDEFELRSGRAAGAIFEFVGGMNLEMQVACIGGNESYYENYYGEVHTDNYRDDISTQAQISIRNAVGDELVNDGIIEAQW